VAVFLGTQGWSQEEIGFALSAGGIAGLLAQWPGGELLDVVHSKRALIALGVIGYYLSNRAMFFTTAVLVLPVLVALAWIRADDIHFGRSVGAPDHRHATRPPRVRRRAFWKNRHLLVFAGCLSLFQLVDASMLPLIGGTLAQTKGSVSALIMSGLVIMPQVFVALMAPWAGRRAKSWGRRPPLLIGFGVLPIRTLLFTVISDPWNGVEPAP
jgi:MFS family permease